MPSSLIKKGAEAELLLTDWYGLPAVVKRRVPKPYRRADFDRALRRYRTIREASLLLAARRAGVSVPALYCVDVVGSSITMEYVPGPTVKDLLVKGMGVEEVMKATGRSIGKLHLKGLVHGDLTTSNMIWSAGKVFLMDFGLGEFERSLEAMGVDLHLMLRSLESIIPLKARSLFKQVVEGYREVMGSQTSAVVERVKLIRFRGRYVEARKLSSRK
ncbi:MAG: Kae1-associated kinase Bud32 [Thermoprotei archaeon]|nr:MAG: Kae1-associated kinase Bud32 [Thermoprotei archaeon]